MMTEEGPTKTVNFMTPGEGVLVLWCGHISYIVKIFLYPPQTLFVGVYSDPYVRSFVCSSVPISNPLLLQDC